MKAAFRLLADSGFGGERSRGWGRSEPPEFVEGDLPEMILPPAAGANVAAGAPAALTEELILDRLVAELTGEPVIESSPEEVVEPGPEEPAGRVARGRNGKRRGHPGSPYRRERRQ